VHPIGQLVRRYVGRVHQHDRRHVGERLADRSHPRVVSRSAAVEEVEAAEDAAAPDHRVGVDGGEPGVADGGTDVVPPPDHLVRPGRRLRLAALDDVDAGSFGVLGLQQLQLRGSG
jgi:hypothetical protein